MNNKKIGVSLLVLSVILLIIFVVIIKVLNQEIEALGCFERPGCQTIETSLTIVHFAFGVFGFLFALSFYLFFFAFFSKGDEAIVQRLENDSLRNLEKEKLSILLKGLDEFEKEVITAVREQEGITQNTLRLRVDMSKAKLSQVLGNLEKKGLIKREKERKTFAVYLREKL